MVDLLKDPTTNAANMTAMQLYNAHEIFYGKYEYRNFYSNLRTIKETLEVENRAIKFDEEAFNK